MLTSSSIPKKAEHGEMDRHVEYLWRWISEYPPEYHRGQQTTSPKGSGPGATDGSSPVGSGSVPRLFPGFLQVLGAFFFIFLFAQRGTLPRLLFCLIPGVPTWSVRDLKTYPTARLWLYLSGMEGGVKNPFNYLL